MPSYMLSIDYNVCIRNQYIYLVNIFNIKILGSLGKEHVSISLEMLLDQQPELKELTTHARTAKWYLLGVQLELDSVDLDECTDVTSMYRLWIQEKAEMATRSSLLTALRSIRENNVAKEYENYLRTNVS